MCGFSQSERIDRIAELFGAEPDTDLPAGSYNVTPTDPIHIVVERDGGRRLVLPTGESVFGPGGFI
jgi:putative SOS response-associated peptidase YedK